MQFTYNQEVRMGPLFLSGHRVDLRLLRRDTDFERCWTWVNDPRCRRFLAAYQPVTQPEEEEWFTKNRADSIRLAIWVRGEPAIHIGNIGIQRTGRPENGLAETGTLIGLPEYWSRGYGTDAKMALLRWAFYEFGVRKIISHVYATNPRSLRYSLKCGYRIEARLKQERLKGGRFVDLIRLAVFREDFERAWSRYHERCRRNR